MTLRELVNEGAEHLRTAKGTARESPRREASLLLQAAAGVDGTALLARGDDGVESGSADRYRQMIRRRAEGAPLQTLVGTVGFHDVELLVRDGVFIPRPETELLVEEARREIVGRLASPAEREPIRVLDLCTGSGAVAVAIAAAFRSDPAVSVFAGDRSEEAVALTRENAARNQARVEVRHSDLYERFEELVGACQVIVANPPYLAPEEAAGLSVEVRRDPSPALFDDGDGMGFHRRIAGNAGRYLVRGGLLAMEIGETQGPEVARCLREVGFSDVEVRPDLSGRDRIVQGRWPGDPSPASGGGRKSTRSSCEAGGR